MSHFVKGGAEGNSFLSVVKKGSTFGATQQLTKAPDTTAPLALSEVKRIQKIFGTLLYYSRAVDATMLVALGKITAQQSIATQTTSKCMNHLLY